MTNPTWHAEYARLELAANEATEALRAARKAMHRRRPAANAEAVYLAALAVAQATGDARFNFEMAGCTIVNAADLGPEAMFPRRIAA